LLSQCFNFQVKAAPGGAGWDYTMLRNNWEGGFRWGEASALGHETFILGKLFYNQIY